jgi:hypothetical protein
VVAGSSCPQATLQVPPWQSAAQAWSGLQLTLHESDSSPVGVQLIVHGPGSQLGVHLRPPGRSQWKLQVVPEHSITQSERPLHPTRHS